MNYTEFLNTQERTAHRKLYQSCIKASEELELHIHTGAEPRGGLYRTCPRCVLQNFVLLHGLANGVGGEPRGSSIWSQEDVNELSKNRGIPCIQNTES